MDLGFVVAGRRDNVDRAITEIDLGETVRPISEVVETPDTLDVEADYMNIRQMHELNITCTMIEVAMSMDYKQRELR